MTREDEIAAMGGQGQPVFAGGNLAAQMMRITTRFLGKGENLWPFMEIGKIFAPLGSACESISEDEKRWYLDLLQTFDTMLQRSGSAPVRFEGWEESEIKADSIVYDPKLPKEEKRKKLAEVRSLGNILDFFAVFLEGRQSVVYMFDHEGDAAMQMRMREILLTLEAHSPDLHFSEERTVFYLAVYDEIIPDEEAEEIGARDTDQPVGRM